MASMSPSVLLSVAAVHYRRLWRCGRCTGVREPKKGGKRRQKTHTNKDMQGNKREQLDGGGLLPAASHQPSDLLLLPVPPPSVSLSGVRLHGWISVQTVVAESLPTVSTCDLQTFCHRVKHRTSHGHAAGVMQQQNQERLLKVLVIGDLGVGKTSVIKRYVHEVFSQHYRATIGVDFALKVLNWEHGSVLRLQLWDIAGQERYGNMTRVYYREAVGALVVFDMTRLSTFQAVLKWKGDLDSKVTLKNGKSVPAVLLANKCDQSRNGLCPKLPKLENFSRQYGFVDWFETSAKDNTNIDAAITCLVKSILSAEDERQASSNASSAAAKSEQDGSVLVLPQFHYNEKENGLGGCSGCSSLKKHRDNE
uniref:Ras-related protein Rab n=2 Tax=Cynoglossus semilaevis TaxID=244447 RepID=A0A3P8WTI2_CYNSE